MSKNNLLTAPLAIDDSAKDDLIPLIAKTIKGENTFSDDVKPIDLRADMFYNEQNQSNYYIPSDNQDPYVATYAVVGMIRSYGYYDESATNVLMRNMAQNDQNPRIKAHVAFITSPGGDASTMFQASEFIHEQITKPKIAYITGMGCSASYCIAAGFDLVICSHEMDRIGSIGIITTMRDYSKSLEMMGIVEHTITADQSTEKGIMEQQALQGNYDLLKKDYLNPMAQAFIDIIQKFRPATIGQDQYFKGRSFFAKDVMGTFIDGIMNQNEVIAEAFKMAKTTPNALNPVTIFANVQKNSPMKMFGYDFSFAKAADGSVSLSAAEYQKLEEKNREAAESENNAKIEAAVAKATEAMKEENTQLKASIEKVIGFMEAAPGAKVAVPGAPAAEGEKVEEKPIWEKFNVMAQEYINKGEKMFS